MSMGKGTIYLMISGLIFTLSGYAIHIGLGRYLGPAEYGVYGIVISIISVVNLMLTTGIPRGASKFLSEKRDWNKDLIRKSLILQFSFSIVVFIAFFLLSPYIAKLLRDESLTDYIRISAFIIPFYALNSIYHQGLLNGYKLYKKQALTKISYSISKAAFIFILVFAGLGIVGAIFGFLFAALIGLFIGFYFVSKIKIEKSKKKICFPIKKLIKFSIPVLLYSISIFLIFNIDLLSVKAVLKENVDTGFYTSASNIARIPYFIFAGLGLTLLPSISYAFSKNKLKKTQNYISKSLRYMLMILLPGILLISATATPLVQLLYSNVYSNAGAPLEILIIGLGFLAFFDVLSHIIMGSGKPSIASITAILIFTFAFLLNLILIPKYGLIGAAYSTTVASAVGLIIVSVYVYFKFRTLIKLVSFCKILLTSLLVFAIAKYLNLTGLFLIIEYICLYLLFFIILYLIKEIKNSDIDTFCKIIPIKFLKKLKR